MIKIWVVMLFQPTDELIKECADGSIKFEVIAQLGREWTGFCAGGITGFI